MQLSILLCLPDSFWCSCQFCCAYLTTSVAVDPGAMLPVVGRHLVSDWDGRVWLCVSADHGVCWPGVPQVQRAQSPSTHQGKEPSCCYDQCQITCFSPVVLPAIFFYVLQIPVVFLLNFCVAQVPVVLCAILFYVLQIPVVFLLNFCVAQVPVVLPVMLCTELPTIMHWA